MERAIESAYQALSIKLKGDSAPHPVRIWNFVPDILADGGDNQDRYMRFNAGRYRAFLRWFGGSGCFDAVLPAASAVGVAGRDLVIHALACREPGVPIENPRQRAPHCYSRRFGPLPPCFARAMLVPDGSRRLLLVGGTASVRDEESVHGGDLPAQLQETMENLAAVAREGLGADDPLSRFRAIRAYYVRARDLPEISRAVGKHFPQIARPEFLQADLCRSDLMVEIEGLAAAASARPA